ncbi:MAG: DUF4173 domain-containing protein [Atopobiaceae bacterium]|jgi:hypothetical protein|nr:DUF4173 domain-containing protein [Atopobiaceae bacterium]MCI1318677.1 DUF4173 domain-containing protein [Atopobiaceae bacterium]MCI1389660.1 DUF4173 domain-containing protein [Atopobiaceae bacterium]MCI1431554.1 DUF4173 domain-containing protein [Atopobiaceae bacterium]MCI1469990.1 DUF4173 domain-containing protein [Atopobiaceae bacterium]
MPQGGLKGERPTLPGTSRRFEAVALAAALAALWCVAADGPCLSGVLVLAGGWPFGALIVAFFACLALVRRGRGTAGAWERVFVALSCALACVPALTWNVWVRAANAFVLGITCMMAYRLALTGGDLSTLSPSGMLRSIGFFAKQQLVHVADAWRSVVAFVSGSSGEDGRARGKASAGAAMGIVVGVAAAALLLCVTLPLLAQADDGFARLFGAVSPLEALLAAEGWLRRILRWLAIWALAASLLVAGVVAVPSAQGHAVGDVPGSRTSGERDGACAAVVTALALVDAAYLAFVAFELPYLFGGAAAADVAEYARSGFFQLAAVAAINLVALGAALAAIGGRAGGAPHPVEEDAAPLRRIDAIVRALELVLCAASFVMLASAAWRMGLYVGAYGLSLLRLGVIWAMVGIACMLMLCVARVLRPAFPAFRVGLAIACALWAGFCLERPARVVADYDAGCYLAGELREADVAYLADLGPESLPALRRLAADAPDADVREDATLQAGLVESSTQWIPWWEQAILPPSL